MRLQETPGIFLSNFFLFHISVLRIIVTIADTAFAQQIMQSGAIAKAAALIF
jgi:hypothetical protein